MTHIMKIAVAIFLLFGMIDTASGATVIGGINFDDDAFADVLLGTFPSSGTGDFAEQIISGGGISNNLLTLPADFEVLEALVIGADMTASAGLRSSSASITLGFTDLIPVDGPGDDIAIFDHGAIESFDVSIGGITTSVTVGGTGESIGGFAINVALIDLADFGVMRAPTLTISGGASGIDDPDIAAIGALNSTPVPVPTALLLLASGLVTLCVTRTKATGRIAEQKD